MIHVLLRQGESGTPVVGYVPVDNQLCGGGNAIVAMETRALP